MYQFTYQSELKKKIARDTCIQKNSISYEENNKQERREKGRKRESSIEISKSIQIYI